MKPFNELKVNSQEVELIHDFKNNYISLTGVILFTYKLRKRKSFCRNLICLKTELNKMTHEGMNTH